MTTYHPWRELDTLPGVRVVVTELPEGLWGFYDEPTHTIFIDSALSQAEKRCTLTHEMVHAERQDGPTSTPWHERHREQATNETAARRLIPIDALADVLVWTADVHEVAEVLWVDVDTVQIRLATLTKDEEAVIIERIDQDIHTIA